MNYEVRQKPKELITKSFAVIDLKKPKTSCILRVEVRLVKKSHGQNDPGTQQELLLMLQSLKNIGYHGDLRIISESDKSESPSA